MCRTERPKPLPSNHAAAFLPLTAIPVTGTEPLRQVDLIIAYDETGTALAQLDKSDFNL